ncbi:unnamed protein product [Cuscuta epithymum]|uniref:Desiccation-related protein PCC13-62 n=1 Tax=Cuscuta epithymum TaxID=186058 RepID=A0AAV0GG06_9ASTE|nr:unnamed protein product [Cuscuta epithymum]
MLLLLFSCTLIPTLGIPIDDNPNSGPGRAGALPKGDVDLLEFPLNLEYLEAEFFLWGAFGYGLDKFAPNLSSGGPPPVGVTSAKLSPLVKDIIAQFGFQEVGHLRAIKETVPGFPRPLLNLSRETFATIMDKALGHPLKPPFDPYANDINYLIASYLVPYVGLTGYVGANPKLHSHTAKKVSGGALRRGIGARCGPKDIIIPTQKGTSRTVRNNGGGIHRTHFEVEEQARQRRVER